MDLHAIYLEIPPEHIAYIKFIIESYEEVGIIRTVDRSKAMIVLLVMPDFGDVARRILDSLKQEVPFVEVPPPANMSADWLMAELARAPYEPQT